MNNNSFKLGLWNKESKSGKTYAKGKVKIENKEYSVTLFTNENKTNEKSPDYNIIIEEYTFTQPSVEKAQEEPKNTKLERNPYEEMQMIVNAGENMDLPF